MQPTMVTTTTYVAPILALPRALGAFARRGLGPVRHRLHPQLGSRKLGTVAALVEIRS